MIAYLEQADTLKYSAPPRRVPNRIDKAIMRAGRMGNLREQSAPSD
ncbi:hypothetical protein [Burkholderia pyrrocinia]|nr:hypothetical protein [Burkholderia pyrrocinia]